MELLKDLITEAATVGDSKIIDVIDKNLKLTDRFGGPVRFGIVRNKQIALALDGKVEREDFIQASISLDKKKGLVWNIKDGRGLAKFKLKKISDREMASVIQTIFNKAKKVK